MTMPTPKPQVTLSGQFVAKRLLHHGACGTWHEAAPSASLNSAALPTEFAPGNGGSSYHRTLVAREPMPGEVLGADAVGIVHRHLAEITAAAWMTDSSGRRLFVQATSFEPQGAASQLAPDRLVAQWRQLVSAVASALAHLHALGLAHGAVHLNNIFQQEGTWRLGPSLCNGDICPADDQQALASLIGTELRHLAAGTHEEQILTRLGELCMIAGIGAAHISVWAETGIPATLPALPTYIPPMPKAERTTDGFRLSGEPGQTLVFLTCEPRRALLAGSSIPSSQLDQVGVCLVASAPGQAEMPIPRQTTVVFCAYIAGGVALVSPHILVDPPRDWGNLNAILCPEGLVLRWFWPKDMTCRTVYIQVRPDRYPRPSDDQDVQVLHRTQYDESGQCLIAVAPHWRRAFVRLSRADINSANGNNAVYANAVRASSDPRTTRFSEAVARCRSYWHKRINGQRLSRVRAALAALCGVALLGTVVGAACWFHGRTPASPTAPAISQMAPLASVDEPLCSQALLTPPPSTGAAVVVDRSQAVPPLNEGQQPASPGPVAVDPDPVPAPSTVSADAITEPLANKPKHIPTPPALPSAQELIVRSEQPQRPSPVDAERVPPSSAGAFSETVAPPAIAPASLAFLAPRRSEIAIAPETPEPTSTVAPHVRSKDIPVTPAPRLPMPSMPRPPAIQYVNLPSAAVALTAIISTQETGGNLTNRKQTISFSVNPTTHSTDIMPLPEGLINHTIAAGDLRIVVIYADGQSVVHRNTKPRYLQAGDTLIEDVKSITAPPALRGPAVQIVGIPTTTKNLQAFVRIAAIRTGAVSEIYIPIRGGDNVVQQTQVGLLPSGIGNTIQPGGIRVIVTLADGETLSYSNTVVVTVSATKVSLLDLSGITPTALPVPARLAPARTVYVSRVQPVGAAPRYGTVPATRPPAR